MDVTLIQYWHVKISSITSDYFALDFSLILYTERFGILPYDEIIFHCIEFNVTCYMELIKNHLISWENVTSVIQLIFISNSLNSCIFPALVVENTWYTCISLSSKCLECHLRFAYVWHMNPNEMWTSWAKHIIKPEWNSQI